MKHLAQRVRRPFEQDWYLNMAYVAGEQNVRWVAGNVNRLVEMDSDEETITAIHNICIKIARTEMAKIGKARPVPVALPVTDSQDDMYAARILDAYFLDLQDTWKFDRRLRNSYYWIVTTGNVWYKWYWAKGEARMAVVSPFDVYVDPYARTMLDARWLIHSQFMSCDQAKEMFTGAKGAKTDHIKEGATDTLSPLESRLFSNFGDGTWNLPGCTVNEYWEPPSASCPEGKYIAFTDSGVIMSTRFPYAHGRLPFTHAGNIERTNSKYHASVIDFVRPFQDELNRTEQQILENRNISNGILFQPAEVELSQPITGQPRQRITWTGPPELNPQNWWVTPQTLPSWVGNEPDRIKGNAQDVVAQHEVSHGGVPGRVESGQAIQLLQETDDSVVTGTIHSVEEAIADGFLMCAFLWKQYGNAERMVRAYDKDGMVAVQTLKKDHISLDLRVRVQTTTGLPQTTAGKWDRVLNMVQYKMIDPVYALKLLDMSNEDPDLVPGAQDRRNAYSENKRMIQHELVEAYPWDDHDIHLEELDKFRKTEEYKRAVALDPTLEQKFGFHEAQHKEMRAARDQEQAQREAAIQQALQPAEAAPPGGGEAGPVEPAPPEPAPNGSPAPVG
jgi:hypothetical protein